jgi:hypothetical protein
MARGGDPIPMIVTIMQPAYLPWSGFFDRVASSDLLILLDHVQIEKGSFTNRNRIRTATGSQWLTIPVRNAGFPRINEVEIAENVPWERKHWAALSTNYAKARFFSVVSAKIAGFYERKHSSLVEAIQEIYDSLAELLGVTTPYVRSSAMNIHSAKAGLVVDLCRSVSATKYISGPLGRNYLDPREFDKAGIELVFHDYEHPTYRQAYDGFEANMSAIDVLFNHGPDALGIITHGRYAKPRP